MRVILTLALLLPALLVQTASARRLQADKRGWFPCAYETVQFQEADPTGSQPIPVRTNFTAADIVDANLGAHLSELQKDNRIAQCAVYHAPLCHEGICNDPKDQKVDIFFKRILANVNDPNKYPNVWFIQGGPGASSIAMEGIMAEMYTRMNGKVNVYTMDHRGTGRSTKLDCVGAQVYTSGGPEGKTFSTIEVPACAADLQEKYGDLASFSVTTAATDLATFIGEETPGSETYYFGVSYGTVVGERLIHLSPKEVKGYVLDGVATTSGSSADNFVAFSKWEESYGEVGDIFLSRCDTTPECKQRFSERSLTQVVDDLIEKLTNEPSSQCGLFLNQIFGGYEPPAFLARRFLGMLLTSQNLRTMIPALAHRLERCNGNDVDVLINFVQGYLGARGSTDPASIEYDSYDSDLLYKLISYSELWEMPTPDEATMLKRFTDHRVVSGNVYYRIAEYCAFSKEKSEVCDKYSVANYPSNPIMYKRDQYFNQTAVIPDGSSVLIMNGILDPQTPHKSAVALYDVMIGKENQKDLVIFEHNAHGVISNTYTIDEDEAACGMQLLISYVNEGGDLTKLDKSCLSRMQPMSFDIPDRFKQMFFKVDDPYDGVIGSNSNGSQSDGSSANGSHDDGSSGSTWNGSGNGNGDQHVAC